MEIDEESTITARSLAGCRKAHESKKYQYVWRFDSDSEGHKVQKQKLSTEENISRFRKRMARMQTQEALWLELHKFAKYCPSCIYCKRPVKSDHVPVDEHTLFKAMENEASPGPVGNYPIHDVFLFPISPESKIKLLDLCTERRLWSSEVPVINIPFENDLNCIREMVKTKAESDSAAAARKAKGHK
eukprot:CAMPEP_0113718982 /NCGR_PEP_ID=MMETSP0038_2-20120614/35527_1 /TAXON_ID=2898 /ORGANISM="Cryptomonas paramecium" /LENGTH=186 /DNA_ID=CAMNT_0000647235 /DNA_START=134 /DNA_END=691 /DNA_ORIENTATION=- /assembly_acc=CAM_ASM_000170